MPISDAGWGAAEIHRTYISNNKIISHGWLSRVLVPRAGSILSESVPCGKPPQRRGNAPHTAVHVCCMRCKTKTRSARRRGGGAEDDDEEQDPTELSWQHPYFTLYIAHTLIRLSPYTPKPLSLFSSQSPHARLLGLLHGSWRRLTTHTTHVCGLWGGLWALGFWALSLPLASPGSGLGLALSRFTRDATSPSLYGAPVDDLKALVKCHDARWALAHMLAQGSLWAPLAPVLAHCTLAHTAPYSCVLHLNLIL